MKLLLKTHHNSDSKQKYMELKNTTSKCNRKKRKSLTDNFNLRQHWMHTLAFIALVTGFIVIVVYTFATSLQQLSLSDILFEKDANNQNTVSRFFDPED